MRYLMLIYRDEKSNPEPGTPEASAMLAEYGAFTKLVQDRSAYQIGEPLQPVATATTVRVRDGERLISDGPFAETKEQLGGFYLLKCDNLDEAIDYAARIPAVRYGSIEVRPIMEMG